MPLRFDYHTNLIRFWFFTEHGLSTASISLKMVTLGVRTFLPE